MKAFRGPALQVITPLKVMDAFQGSFFQTSFDLARSPSFIPIICIGVVLEGPAALGAVQLILRPCPK